jgi:hypothetical protein
LTGITGRKRARKTPYKSLGLELVLGLGLRLVLVFGLMLGLGFE